jgi:hypothetical protein
MIVQSATTSISSAAIKQDLEITPPNHKQIVTGCPFCTEASSFAELQKRCPPINLSSPLTNKLLLLLLLEGLYTSSYWRLYACIVAQYMCCSFNK